MAFNTIWSVVHKACLLGCESNWVLGFALALIRSLGKLFSPLGSAHSCQMGKLDHMHSKSPSALKFCEL